MNLRAEETTRLMVALDACAFSYYDASAKQSRTEQGELEVLGGRPS